MGFFCQLNDIRSQRNDFLSTLIWLIARKNAQIFMIVVITIISLSLFFFLLFISICSVQQIFALVRLCWAMATDSPYVEPMQRFVNMTRSPNEIYILQLNPSDQINFDSMCCSISHCLNKLIIRINGNAYAHIHATKKSIRFKCMQLRFVYKEKKQICKRLRGGHGRKSLFYLCPCGY